MKTLRVLSLTLFLISSAAYADSSKILGSWISGCNSAGKVSYRTVMVIRDDGTIQDLELDYGGNSCQSAPSVNDAGQSTYRLISESESAVVIAISIPGKEDGQFKKVTVDFTFEYAEKAVEKTLSATRLVNGKLKKLSSEEIAAMAPTTLTKNY